jgi:hypothetical protein
MFSGHAAQFFQLAWLLCGDLHDFHPMWFNTLENNIFSKLLRILETVVILYSQWLAASFGKTFWHPGRHDQEGLQRVC